MRCSSVLALLALVTGQVTAQEPAALDARLSPDGTTVVARAIDGGSIRLVTLTPYDSLGEPVWLTPPGVDVEAVSWAPDGTRLVYRDARDGHLHVLPAGPGAAPSAARDLTPGATGDVRLAGFAGDTAALVEMPGERPGQPDLYRVPLAGGDPVLVRANDGGITRWLVEGGAARLVVREGEGDTEIARIREDAIVPIYPCGDAAVCEPVGLHPDGRVWVRSSRDRAAPALELVDPLLLDTEVVRSDLGIDPNALVREDSVYARDAVRLGELFGDAEVRLHDAPGGSGGRMLVTARDATGGALYVFDRWAGSVERVLPLAEEEAVLSAIGFPAPAPDATVDFPDELRYRISDGEPGMPPTDVRRTIERTVEGGRPVLVVVDATEVPVFPAFALDTALLADPTFEPDLSFPMDDLSMVEATDSTVLDATTLRPIRRRASGPFAVELDFGPDGVTGSISMEGFETRIDASAAGPLWTDGAALELLVAALPLDEGYETALTYFDSGLQEVLTARLSVTGATRAETEAGTFDAWSVTLAPDAGEVTASSWLVRRNAPHTLLRATTVSDDYDRLVELIEGGESP